MTVSKVIYTYFASVVAKTTMRETTKTRVVKLLLIVIVIVIVIVMKHIWSDSNSNSNRFLKIPE